MDAILEKIENSEAYIEIEVDADKLEEGMQKAYRKVIKEVNIPGFRKGRAPRELLEAHYGKEVLLQEALEFIIPYAYEEALQMLNIEAIAQPDFEFGDSDPTSETYKFKARVPVKPEIKLGKLEGLEISIPKLEVTEADVDKRLEDIRTRYAELREKTDEAAELGDNATIDFEGLIDGEAFAGGKSEDFVLELGSGSFIPGFEDQLVGLKKGEEPDINVNFPEDYHVEKLAGKSAVFKVRINKIETKIMRPLDDELAQEVSDFDTIEALREDLLNKMIKMTDERRKDIVKQAVLNKALQECEIQVATAVVREQVQRMMQQMEQNLAMQGLTFEQYFKYTNSNEQEFAANAWPQAAHTTKINFMLEKLVEEKGFEVNDEELEKKIQEIAANMGIEYDKAQEKLADSIDNIKFNVKLDKAMNYLVENAIINETSGANQETDSCDESTVESV